VLYFPAGTYLVSSPLEWRRKGPPVVDLAHVCRARIEIHTIIRLADSTQEFQDPQAPQAVIVTGSQNPSRAGRLWRRGGPQLHLRPNSRRRIGPTSAPMASHILPIIVAQYETSWFGLPRTVAMWACL